eukprot:1994983-Amphidinium_carterae.1
MRRLNTCALYPDGVDWIFKTTAHKVINTTAPFSEQINDVQFRGVDSIARVAPQNASELQRGQHFHTFQYSDNTASHASGSMCFAALLIQIAEEVDYMQGGNAPQQIQIAP